MPAYVLLVLHGQSTTELPVRLLVLESRINRCRDLGAGFKGLGVLLEPSRGLQLRRMFVRHAVPLQDVPVLQDAMWPLRPGGPDERLSWTRQALVHLLKGT